MNDKYESTEDLLDKSISGSPVEVERSTKKVSNLWKMKCKRTFVGALAVLLALSINTKSVAKDTENANVSEEVISLAPIYNSDFSDYKLCLKNNFYKVVEDLTKVGVDENNSISTDELAETMAKHADRDKLFTNIELLSFTKILGKDVANKIISKSKYAEMNDVDSYMKDNNVSTIDEWCDKTTETFANRDYFTIKNAGLYDFGREDDNLQRIRSFMREDIEKYAAQGLSPEEIYLNINLTSIYSPVLEKLSKLGDPSEEEVIDAMIKKVTFDNVISNNELLALTNTIGIDTTNKLLQKLPNAPVQSIEEYMKSNNIKDITDWEEKTVQAINKENPFNIPLKGVAEFGSERILDYLLYEEYDNYLVDNDLKDMGGKTK